MNKKYVDKDEKEYLKRIEDEEKKNEMLRMKKEREITFAELRENLIFYDYNPLDFISADYVIFQINYAKILHKCTNLPVLCILRRLTIPFCELITEFEDDIKADFIKRCDKMDQSRIW
jgi:hypothetical protein